MAKSNHRPRLDLALPGCFEGVPPARANTEKLAERIAAVLAERRSIGEKRRQREREYLQRQAELAPLGERRRGEPRASSRRITRDLDALWEAVISSNTAHEAMKEHGMLDGIEDISRTGQRETCGHTCI